MKSFSQLRTNQADLCRQAEDIVLLQDGKSTVMTDEDVRPQVNLLPTANMYIMNKNWTSENKQGRISSPLDARVRRLRANDRERRRIQSINGAMEALRRVIPDTQNNRKVTKLQLLKLAQNYIKYLSEVLQTTEVTPMQTSAYRITTQIDLDSHGYFQQADCDSFIANCFGHHSS